MRFATKRPIVDKGKIVVSKYDIYERDGYVCIYCGEEVHQAILEVDHIFPKVKGGKNTVSNVVTSCNVCNGAKSGKILDNLELYVQIAQDRNKLLGWSDDTHVYKSTTKRNLILSNRMVICG